MIFVFLQKTISSVLPSLALLIIMSGSLNMPASNDTLTGRPDTSSKQQITEKPPLLNPLHRNVIRFNPTPMLVCSNVRNITLAYEHLVKPNQSFMVQAGYLNFTPFQLDSIKGITSVERESNLGGNVGFDYRFYLFKRNGRPAPDGIYIGPYASYYGFKYTSKITMVKSDTIFTTNLTSGYNLINVGMVVGYQFILWKRLSIDMVLLGPSLTYFITNKEISNEIDQETLDEVNDKIEDIFRERYPLIAQMLSVSGSKSSASLGNFFRYSVSIGYHFK